MASNNGYSNIPQSVRSQIMQNISTQFAGPEAVALINVIDLLFASLSKRANLAGATNTGFANMTGSNDKSALPAGSATTAQLAGRVKAIEDALKAAGIIST
jgi:hypothetical protein